MSGAFVMFQDGPGGHLGSALAVSARLLCAFPNVFIHSLFFFADASHVFFI
jgi:hypothetical protein